MSATMDIQMPMKLATDNAVSFLDAVTGYPCRVVPSLKEELPLALRRRHVLSYEWRAALQDDDLRSHRYTLIEVGNIGVQHPDAA